MPRNVNTQTQMSILRGGPHHGMFVVDLSTSMVAEPTGLLHDSEVEFVLGEINYAPALPDEIQPSRPATFPPLD